MTVVEGGGLLRGDIPTAMPMPIPARLEDEVAGLVWPSLANNRAANVGGLMLLRVGVKGVGAGAAPTAGAVDAADMGIETDGLEWWPGPSASDACRWLASGFGLRAGTCRGLKGGGTSEDAVPLAVIPSCSNSDSGSGSRFRGVTLPATPAAEGSAGGKDAGASESERLTGPSAAAAAAAAEVAGPTNVVVAVEAVAVVVEGGEDRAKNNPVGAGDGAATFRSRSAIVVAVASAGGASGANCKSGGY